MSTPPEATATAEAAAAAAAAAATAAAPQQPSTSTSTLEELLGPSLLTNNNNASNKGGVAKKEATAAALQDKDLILLYFSANWCPPCQTFLPLLTAFYNHVQSQKSQKSHKEKEKDGGDGDGSEQNMKLEIVYVSSDRTVADFQAYYGKMPWLALPSDDGAAAIKNGLAEQLQITGIPTLVVLDRAGRFVTDAARESVTAAAGDRTKCMDLCREWKEAEAVPLAQAKLGGAGQTSMFAGGFTGIVMTILKNPMYIFGMIYIVKWVMRQIDEMKKSGGALDQDKEL